jgi:hypothetical protein
MQKETPVLLREIAATDIAKSLVFDGFTLAQILSATAQLIDVDTGHPAGDLFEPDGLYRGQDIRERLNAYEGRLQRLLAETVRRGPEAVRRDGYFSGPTG